MFGRNSRIPPTNHPIEAPTTPLLGWEGLEFSTACLLQLRFTVEKNNNVGKYNGGHRRGFATNYVTVGLGLLVRASGNLIYMFTPASL